MTSAGPLLRLSLAVAVGVLASCAAAPPPGVAARAGQAMTGPSGAGDRISDCPPAPPASVRPRDFPRSIPLPSGHKIVRAGPAMPGEIRLDAETALPVDEGLRFYEAAVADAGWKTVWRENEGFEAEVMFADERGRTAMAMILIRCQGGSLISLRAQPRFGASRSGDRR